MKYLLVLFLGIGALSASACRSRAPASEMKAETVTLAVYGMTCPACPPRVRSALRSVPGVESAQVDLDAKTATVTYRSGCDPKALVAALQKQGFGATVK